MLLFLIFSFCAGAIIGSFANCFIWRLHEEETLFGRSYCPKCRRQINWYDNIPILSFVFLGGKCRQCHKKISWQYPLVEFFTALFFALAFWRLISRLAPGFDYDNFILLSEPKFIFSLVRDWLIIFVFVVIFIYDLRWYLIPDKVVLPACLLVFLLNLALGFNWPILLLSGVIGGGFFLLQFVISRGKWIGGGDIRLGLFMGLAFGILSHLVLALVLAYFIGSIIAVILVLKKKKQWGSEIPLGIFLAVSSLITLFYGQEIISWYWSISLG